jgi:hypothetical protein
VRDFKPTDELKLKAWEFMKKHALPRIREAEKKKELKYNSKTEEK